MNDDGTTAADTMSSPRLEQFQQEVAKLKVSGGGANPERLGAQWGIGLTILGFVIAVIGWWSALDAGDALSALRCQTGAAIGIGLSIVGIVIWARNSMTRYLRYWIIRIVYEEREQAEAIARALRDK